MWRALGPLIGFLALASVLALTLVKIDMGKLDVRQISSPLIGQSAPVFELASVQDPDVKVSTRAMLGAPWVLNVWATWCVACRQEHPTLLALADKSLVPIIGLNWKDDRELANQWLRQLGNPYAKVAYDPEGRAAIDWGVYGSPETFLISADGIVLEKHIGPMTVEIWRDKFMKRLAEHGNRTGGGA